MRMMFLTGALLAVTAGTAMAQDDAATTAARALILPMLAETAPGPASVVLTDCVIASATPEEIATFAAASAPSMAVGQKITEILARPDSISCISAATQ